MGKFILNRGSAKKMVAEIMASRFEAICKIFNANDLMAIVERHIQELEKDGEREPYIDVGKLDSEAIYDELIDEFLALAEKQRYKRARRDEKKC